MLPRQHWIQRQQQAFKFFVERSVAQEHHFSPSLNSNNSNGLDGFQIILALQFQQDAVFRECSTHHRLVLKRV